MTNQYKASLLTKNFRPCFRPNASSPNARSLLPIYTCSFALPIYTCSLLFHTDSYFLLLSDSSPLPNARPISPLRSLSTTTSGADPTTRAVPEKTTGCSDGSETVAIDYEIGTYEADIDPDTDSSSSDDDVLLGSASASASASILPSASASILPSIDRKLIKEVISNLSIRTLWQQINYSRDLHRTFVVFCMSPGWVRIHPVCDLPCDRLRK